MCPPPTAPETRTAEPSNSTDDFPPNTIRDQLPDSLLRVREEERRADSRNKGIFAPLQRNCNFVTETVTNEKTVLLQVEKLKAGKERPG